MDALFLAYAATTLALLIAQLLDYVAEQEHMPLSRCNVTVLNVGSTGIASSSVAKPQVQYDRAA